MTSGDLEYREYNELPRVQFIGKTIGLLKRNKSCDFWPEWINGNVAEVKRISKTSSEVKCKWTGTF